MNGYLMILLDMFFVGTIWYCGGVALGLFALAYCTLITILNARYTRFARNIIIGMREKIESLGGEI